MGLGELTWPVAKQQAALAEVSLVAPSIAHDAISSLRRDSVVQADRLLRRVAPPGHHAHPHSDAILRFS